MNFFQPSFNLKEKRREGAKVIKRYHAPATPYERALQHPKVPRTIKQRLRAQYRTLDPVMLLSEIRAAQDELGRRIDRRGLSAASQVPLPISNRRLCADARHVDRSRRAARYAPMHKEKIQDPDPHALEA